MRRAHLLAWAWIGAGISLAAAGPPPSTPAAPPAPAAPRTPPARAWIGIYFGDAVDGGVQILEVVPDGPAARAGLASGDLVIRVEGKDVASRGDFSRALEGRAPGDKLKLTILRAAKTQDAVVVLGTPRRVITPLPPARVESYRLPDEPTSAAAVLGIGVGEIPSDLRKHMGGPAEAGLLVLRVEENGTASRALKVGDLLVTVGGHAVATEADLDTSILERGSGAVTLAGRRGGQPFSSDVELKQKSAEERARELRVRYLEATIRQMEIQLEDLRRQLLELSERP